ncbi:MAG: hypothetical protein II889_03810 [Clostridia bacterium]|nr:hypothetical protein [Clostridia bacterium]
MEKKLIKILISLLLVLLAAVSCFLVSRMCDNSKLNSTLLASLDEKTSTVMKLTSASAVASAGISAIPGDTATPIAEKLADLTGYFLIVLSVLYTEKALLTLLGAAAFKVLIPLACLAGIIGVWFWGRGKLLAKKLALFAVAIAVAIPVSLLVSDGIYDKYSARIDETLASSEELNEATAPLAEADEDASIVATILSRLSETATSLANKAAVLLNRYVESVAILVVTSCILPCLGLVCILWLTKLLFGVDVIARARPGRTGANPGERPADYPGPGDRRRV